MFNKRLFSLVLTAGLILGLAGLAMAGVPDPGQSSVYSSGGVATLTPGGLAQSLATYGVIVTVTIRDLNGLPIPSLPAADMWLDDIGNGDINLCQSGSTADAATNSAGFTTISGIMSGGGWTQAGASAYVSGVAITGGNGPVLSIDFNSPDINGDRIVDLGDIGLFQIDVQPPNNAFRSDYTHDGIVDLGDIGLFSIWIDDVCP